MKILPNIIPAIKFAYALRYLNEYKKHIAHGRATGNIEEEKEGMLNATSSWGLNILRIFEVDLHVNGLENLPKEGPVVYVSNHQGYADIPTLCAVLNTVQVGFVAKDDLEKVPFYGKWIKRIRSILLKRDDARASLRAIEDGVGLIKQGFSLVIFPEGTRSKGGPMKEFKKGSLRLATKPEAPIIPVTINGTYVLFEKEGKVSTGHRVDVTIHPAVETKGLSKQEQGQLVADVECTIRTELDRLINETAGEN